MLSVSCLYNIDDFGSSDLPDKEPVTSTGSPEMGSFQAIRTDVAELSGICLAADGKSLLGVSDDKKLKGGIYSISFAGPSTIQLKILKDLEGITMNPATKDIYLAVEGEQKVYKVAAPSYGVPQEVGKVENGASDPSGKGLEGITWYKNDTLIVANQASPCVISFFSLASREAVRKVSMPFAGYLSDICYDPVDDVLWIADSKSERIYRASLSGKLLTTYDISAMVNTGGAGKSEALCVDRANSCLWVGCDVTDYLFKVSMNFGR